MQNKDFNEAYKIKMEIDNKYGSLSNVEGVRFDYAEKDFQHKYGCSEKAAIYLSAWYYEQVSEPENKPFYIIA